MQVNLTYFKPSGKYYSSGDFFVPLSIHLFEVFEITLKWQKTCWKQRNHRFELVLLNSDQTVGKAGNINDEVGGELLKSLQARLSAADTKRNTEHEIAQDNLVNEILSLLQGLK